MAHEGDLDEPGEADDGEHEDESDELCELNDEPLLDEADETTVFAWCRMAPRSRSSHWIHGSNMLPSIELRLISAAVLALGPHRLTPAHQSMVGFRGACLTGWPAEVA